VNSRLRTFLLALLFASITVNTLFGSIAVGASAPDSGPPGQGALHAAVSGDPQHPASCALPALVLPPTPSKIPGYAELDPTTGLHVTGAIQEISLEQYRLEVTGKVNHPLKLGYDELRCMPRIAARPPLVCVGFFTDIASWAGVPLKYVIEKAEVKAGATSVRLIGADNYSASMSMTQATGDGNFLAYEWEGKALPRLHGFPLRAVFPGLEGNQWVKWLIRIEVY
jgi:DMSO/TMAO reductase YedYZ molybdopterin-dependent catalytic subunit